MEITKNKVVTLTYELTLPDVENKPVVDKADTENPFSFVYGTGITLEAFEANLSGLKKGDKFDFNIEANKAYGPQRDEAVIDLPKDIFQVEGETREDLLKPGNVIPMKDHEGNHLEGQVLDVLEDKVKMDFNHPLAGKDLHFKGEVIDMREATPEEIESGEIK